jgi:hypothetical protein
VGFSPQADYTDCATATCWRNLVPTFVDRGVSRGQGGGSSTVVNLSFLDRETSAYLYQINRRDVLDGRILTNTAIRTWNRPSFCGWKGPSTTILWEVSA